MTTEQASLNSMPRSESSAAEPPPRTDLRGKTAIVTGSARGLGKAIAERYARLGADIVLNYSKDKSAADEMISVIEALGRKIVAVQADVSKVEDVIRLFETAQTSFGKIDIVVANAGIEITGLPVADVTEEQFDRFFDINTKGSFFTLQNAARHVADGGRIIYIGSGTTSYPMPGIGLYGGSKMAPLYLIRVLAQELGHRGVAVNAIIPTAIDGAGIFTDPSSFGEIREFVSNFCPMGRMGRPEDVADVAEFFASELSAFVSGQHLLVSGGGLG
jgi:3-oxoacyl-[acyl-carrier protein] reductase